MGRWVSPLRGSFLDSDLQVSSPSRGGWRLGSQRRVRNAFAGLTTQYPMGGVRTSQLMLRYWFNPEQNGQGAPEGGLESHPRAWQILRGFGPVSVV